jgi:hypothetical protein
MTTMSKIKAHESIARFQTCKKYSSIGLCSTMGLNIGKFGTKKFFSSVYCYLLSLINNLTTTVITFTRVTFGVFIGQNRTHCLKNFFANKVFGGNQFNSMHLTIFFLFDKIENLGIVFHIPVIFLIQVSKIPFFSETAIFADKMQESEKLSDLQKINETNPISVYMHDFY